MDGCIYGFGWSLGCRIGGHGASTLWLQLFRGVEMKSVVASVVAGNVGNTPRRET